MAYAGTPLSLRQHQRRGCYRPIFDWFREKPRLSTSRPRRFCRSRFRTEVLPSTLRTKKTTASVSSSYPIHDDSHFHPACPPGHRLVDSFYKWASLFAPACDRAPATYVPQRYRTFAASSAVRRKSSPCLRNAANGSSRSGSGARSRRSDTSTSPAICVVTRRSPKPKRSRSSRVREGCAGSSTSRKAKNGLRNKMLNTVP